MKQDIDRIVFHSVGDMSSGYYLPKSENILKNQIDNIQDINNALELYNIKLYFDNGVYLKKWSEQEFESFQESVKKFSKILGEYISKINNDNFQEHYNKLATCYVDSFWEVINNFKVFRAISGDRIKESLKQNPHDIRIILKHELLVKKYNTVLCEFLKEYEDSAEIILTIYEIKDDFNTKLYLPSSLSVKDKETIISTYINSDHCNYNYLPIIQNTRKHNNDFYISDPVKLAAKRKYQSETQKLFNSSSNHLSFGVAISFPRNKLENVTVKLEDRTIHYEYSIDFIKSNSSPYALYSNFRNLFEYLDIQHRINLISKESQLGIFERYMGVRSKNEYITGTSFTQSEMTSNIQIYSYSRVLNDLGYSIENIIKIVFSKIFPERYGLSSNVHFEIPTKASSALEKIRVIAPEFESILKQYKLFVENGEVDYELLRISSAPTPIKNIPSLNANKYIYANRNNPEVNKLMHLLCSDQTLLTYVEPFKDKKYKNFVELLANESEILFSNYEEHDLSSLNYLISNECIFIDENNYIKIKNLGRIFIMKDLFHNYTASFYRYTPELQAEAQKMHEESLLYFGSTLFSEPEQNYLNYYLNKSDFTNGLDIRNSYLHGTQANHSEVDTHENLYLIYLKLIVLVTMKIEDDLFLSEKNKTTQN